MRHYYGAKGFQMKTEELLDRKSEAEIRSDWFMRMARRRQDFLEAHPHSSGVLANMEELAMFLAAAGVFRAIAERERHGGPTR